ncbi:MAG: chromosome partitioning protein ParA, partial [Ignavibacteria bacterium]|nr:chromosome partitioning protein ParA [Ignavibacteria bacterium]
TEISERELRIKYEDYILNTNIPVTNLLNEATFYGKPLCMYKINSEGALAYINLAYEILHRNQINAEIK